MLPDITLSSVLYAPTRYLFVKDPCPTGKRKSSLSTTSTTVKTFLFLFFKLPSRSALRKGRVNLLTLSPAPGQPLSCHGHTQKEDKKSPGDDLLSHQWTGSIIGAGGLNFRVRNGIGWGPSAVVTRTKYVRKQVKRES